MHQRSNSLEFRQHGISSRLLSDLLRSNSVSTNLGLQEGHVLLVPIPAISNMTESGSASLDEPMRRKAAPAAIISGLNHYSRESSGGPPIKLLGQPKKPNTGHTTAASQGEARQVPSEVATLHRVQKANARGRLGGATAHWLSHNDRSVASLSRGGGAHSRKKILVVGHAANTAVQKHPMYQQYLQQDLQK